MKFFDDIRVGEVSDLGRHTFTAEDIKSFAARSIRSRFISTKPRRRARISAGSAPRAGTPPVSGCDC
jgi:hypothetical protein